MIAETSLAKVVNRLGTLIPVEVEQRQADFDAATTCRECGTEVDVTEVLEGADRLILAGLNEDMAQGLLPRCSLCISQLLAQNVADVVLLEVLLVALEKASAGKGRVWILYDNSNGERRISVTTNAAVVKEMRNRREPGQALLYLGRIA